MRRIASIASLLVFAVVLFFLPGSVQGAKNFKLDGGIDDWKGRAFLSDGHGDGPEGQDFRAIFWGTNENENRLYFMVERYLPLEAGKRLTCRLYFDINANGDYEDNTDKFAEVVYSPGHEKGEVAVRLYSIGGALLTTYIGNWGEGAGSGGRRFEFYLPMDALDIYPAQPVRFYLAGPAMGSDRLPDKGDNQWMPFPGEVKGTFVILVVFLIWLLVVALLRRHRIWLFYYIWGSVGFTLIIVLLLRGSFVEQWMEYHTGLVLHHLLGFLDIRTYVFERAYGVLLVLIEVDNSWTTVDIDIESSSLLEMCIFLGLLLFYPAYPLTRRVLFSMAGIALIYGINILRLLVIISVIHWGGRSMIFVAHTLLGRIIFFLFIIALYWHFFTKPSLKIVREDVKDA